MATERGTRKLAAIMFTDIKSFSKKMSESEELAMELLRIHDDTLKAVIEKYEGKIIKAIGDAFMVDFSSAVNAVKCAIEAQEDFHKYNSDKKKELEKIEVRIGIHLGDVITDGNDIFGDGVNIAARIEAVTEPNRICISQDVFSQIKNKMPVKTFHMGSIDLKNIPEPMEVYEILIDHIPEFAEPSKSAQQMPSKRTAEKVTKREAKEAEKVEAAKKKAEDDKAKAERETSEKVQQILTKAEKLMQEGKVDAAEKEVNEIFKYVAFHAGAQLLQARIEEEKHKKADEDRKKSAAQRKVKLQVGELMEEALRMVDTHKYAEAQEKLQEIYAVDPENEDAKELEARVKDEAAKQPPPEEEPESEQAAVEAGPVEEKPAVTADLPEPEAQPQVRAGKQQRQPLQPERRQVGLKPKSRSIPPIVRNLLILVVIAGVGVALYPTIEKILFPADTSIVIAPFVVPAESDTTGLGTIIASLLESDLSAYKELIVIRSGNLEGRRISPSQLATAVQARYVLSGQISSMAPRLSVRLRLSYGGETTPIEEWTIEGDSYDLSVLRSGVISHVIQHMQVEVEPHELSELTGNPEVKETFLRAMWYSSQFNRDNVLYGQSLFLDIIRADSGFVPAYTGMGRALLRQYKVEGERDKSLLRAAVDAAIRARGLNPSSAAAFEVLGTAYLAAGRMALASKTLDQSLDLLPGNPQAYRQKALLSIMEGDYSNAFTLASKAHLLDPNNPESHEILGHSFYFQEQMTSAEQEYDRSIALSGTSYFITTRFKMAVWGAGLSPEPAVQYCTRLLREDSTNYVVRYWAGRAYMLSGIWSEARKYLEPGAEFLKKIVEFSPMDANAHAYLALYYARLGESANGLAEMERAVQLAGESVLLKYRRAQFYAIQTDKKAEALDWLQKAVQQEFILSEVMSPDFAFLRKDPGFAPAISLSEASDSSD